jgi:MarR family 2-MHQ and catechol resistance regulon transcriptional repressor
MAAWTSKQARRSAFIPVMRELVRCYQAFERFDAAPHRERGLTTSQADVIFTLGNTEGLTCKEIGERTLITKGTLTGVIDRLERKKLVRRVPSADDRRSTRIVLTVRGERLFEEIYPEHIAYLKQRFDRLSSPELKQTGATLRRLRALFD